MRTPNQYRIRTGQFKSEDSDGNNGLFIIPGKSSRNTLKIIASDGHGWEHVSVSKQYECPTWDEMCMVKDLFWDAKDCVLQYHPPISRYVNNSKYCLHLWLPRDCGEIPFPPDWMVGIKSLGVLG